MAPTIVLRDGRPFVALGLPGGVRIFTSVMQALVNLIDHGMSLQEDGTLAGASCWRADGSPIGIGGGYARPGIRFWPDARRG